MKGKPCKLLIAPTDVRLSDLDVVAAGYPVVCDLGHITPTHTEGAPDVLIEVPPQSGASAAWQGHVL